MKIVFTGGGTMGHIFPIIAVVRELRNLYPGENLKIYYLGPKQEYGTLLFQELNVKVKHVIAGKMRRYFSFHNILDIFKVPVGFLQSLFWLFFAAPDFVYSKGGYGSLPVSLACLFLRTPLILQESDTTPGLASKISSKWAVEIFTSFPNTDYFPKDKIICMGNPIRKELLKGEKRKALELFNMKGDKTVLLILGGSLGSQRINSIILEILPDLIKNFEILHQTGKENLKLVEPEAKAILGKEKSLYYHGFGFLNEQQLKHALACSDLIISRAGSGALFEIAAAGKPAILIPLPESAQDHQSKNAFFFAQMGGGEVIEEQNLKPNFFLQKIESVLHNQEGMKIMAQNSAFFARPESATKIASYLLEYLSLI